MPAKFTVYVQIASASSPRLEDEKVVLSPTTYIEFFKKLIYNDPECKNEPIGIKTYQSLVHTFPTGKPIVDLTTYYNFNEKSGLPYGDANILITSQSIGNYYVNGKKPEGDYYEQVNSTLSTGEWSGQVGYVKQNKKNANSISNKYEFNFPLPIVTYTNTFNSLPQPSTAPLPA